MRQIAAWLLHKSQRLIADAAHNKDIVMRKLPLISMKTLTLFVLLSVWALFVPSIFVLLYTTIEMQSAAKAAAGDSAKLAPFRISREAERIRYLEENVAQLKTKINVIEREKINLYRQYMAAYSDTWSKVRASWQTFWNKSADAPECDDIKACLEVVVAEDRQHRWDPGAEISKGVRAAEAAAAKLSVIEDAMELRKVELGRLEATLEKEEAELTQGSAPSAVGSSIERRSADDIRSVAMSFNKQREMPLFEYLFFFPPGVVVAFFTALMGAIGAVIFSLMQALKSNPAAVPGKSIQVHLGYAFVARPVLGALAGFTVFFVISAGATFLIQPAGLDAAQAVNQLSPPALASLGIFAGLSSERALEWLIEKAEAFFGTEGAESSTSPVKRDN